MGLEFCLSLRGKHLHKKMSGLTFEERMDFLPYPFMPMKYCRHLQLEFSQQSMDEDYNLAIEQPVTLEL